MDKRLKKTVWIVSGIAVLLAHATTQAEPEHWIAAGEIRAPSGNLYLPLSWDPVQGVALKLYGANEQQGITISFSAGKRNISPFDHFELPPRTLLGTTWHRGSIPREVRDVELTIKLRPMHWSVHIDGETVLEMPRPFDSAARVEIRAEQAESKVSGAFFQRTAPWTFFDDFMVPEDAEAQLLEWDVINGAWSLHTAVDNSVAQRNIQADATRRPAPGQSPNFYSLSASGQRALILAGYPFYDNYRIEAAVQTVPGEKGVIFYALTTNAYHAFTLQIPDHSDTAQLSLWRYRQEMGERREIMAASHVELTRGQWVKLAVETTQGGVRCYLDNTLVIDAPVTLPEGGRFGLYANSPYPIQFDDVYAKSNENIDLSTVLKMRQAAHDESTSFFRSGGLLGQVAPPNATQLVVRAASEVQQVAFGSSLHGQHVLSASFTPREKNCEFGLLTGYQGSNQTAYAFSYARRDGREIFELRKGGPSGAVVETMQLDLSAAMAKRKSITLMLDSTTAGELRCYRNGKLTLIHHADHLGGLGGIFVGPDTTTQIERVSYLSERRNVHRNQHEKNPLFVTDPFMRHWSSPEGEWISFENGGTWHKSDFFGRFSLTFPLIPGTAIHMGASETPPLTNGYLVAQADAKSVILTTTNMPDNISIAIPVHQITAGVQEDETPFYTLHYEDYWIWLTARGETLGKLQLTTPLTGTRIRLSGFKEEHLAKTITERHNVKDFLFKESLHDWTINGGTWTVVNRFQCRPEWSHMTGESEKELAALWTKYQYSGDFCVEMYAGIRHGWYQRCGDLNITVMNNTTSPSDGYTVTCTGWDFDESQLHTKLFRNGIEEIRSDKYLVPRRREGNRRHGYNPLVRAGRDVHGAWYYIKLRRIDGRLEYYFDNELVFSYDDPEPLDIGSLGIWTYRNSMVVARVSIAAESIQPLTRAVRPVELAEAASYPDTPQKHPPFPLRLGRRSANYLHPDLWRCSDSVGQSHLAFPLTADGYQSMTLRNVLGSGSMMSVFKGDPVPLAEVAGWSFLLSRTPDAEFNFHFSVGKLNAEGTYEPSQRFAHRISGSDFTDGPVRMTDTTDVPGANVPVDKLPEAGQWTPVTVWLPVAHLAEFVNDPDMLVQITGFGNVQPSFVAQGLSGNAPGSGYAVARFTEIGTAGRAPVPVTGNKYAEDIELRNATGALIAKGRDVDEIRNAISASNAAGFVEMEVSYGNAARIPLAWVNPSPVFDVLCAWSEETADAIRLETPSELPDLRLANLQLRLADVDIPLFPVAGDALEGIIPKRTATAAAAEGALPLDLVLGERSQTIILSLADRPFPDAPALTGLSSQKLPFFVNFEDGIPVGIETHATVRTGDPVQGRYLRVQNAGQARRLSFEANQDVDLARFPVLHFHYRADEQTRLSAQVNKTHVARISETAKAVAVTSAPEFRTDGTWHAWTGRLSDAIQPSAFAPSFMHMKNIRIASIHAADQTGLYSTWDLDNLVLGPALQRPEAFELTAEYVDFDGIRTVQATVIKGADPWLALSPSARDELIWTDVPNGEPFTPPLSEGEEGLFHLALRAIDRLDNVSPVTDIPFWVDTTPPLVTSEEKATDKFVGNESLLRVTIDASAGTPANLTEIKLLCNGEPTPYDAFGESFQHLHGNIEWLINWPYMLRNHLNQAENAQTLTFSIEGITDGAGNAAEPASFAITMDHATDSTPPTVRRVVTPDHVFWALATEEVEKNSNQITRGKRPLPVQHNPKTGPMLNLSVRAKGVEEHEISLNKGRWEIAKFPYVAMLAHVPETNRDKKSEANLKIALTLTTNHGKHSIFLTETEAKKNGMQLADPVLAGTNNAFAVILDLRKELAETLDSKKLASLHVSAASIDVSSDTHRYAVNIRSLYILGETKLPSPFVLDAFDRSGLSHLAIRKAPQNPPLSNMDMPDLMKENKTSGWYFVTAVDKAGNETWPVPVPWVQDKAPANADLVIRPEDAKVAIRVISD